MNNNDFERRVESLQQTDVVHSLAEIRHGIEREALRIEPNGSLAQTPHPKSLGAALTHETITTDFSESLLEFITPPEKNVNTSLSQLSDVHKYVLANIGEERLWPLSMPCNVKSGDQIPIANYGSSNVGKMKTLYRVGLKNRYGAMMQAISGVHFNFSLPDEFWQHWLPFQGLDADRDNISSAYFALVRNYRKYCWLIPFLYGASPTLCSSFLQGKDTGLPFKKLGKGTLYLPYATSLRMSDLGYTNSAQSALNICYNQLDAYTRSVRKAINTPCADYLRFEGRVNGELQQLNSNILQIENELYSPIRPKQPAFSLEKPTDALHRRGVSYIEVRALDVNPFSPVGIDASQFYFLDVFLLFCLVAPSPMMDSDEFMQSDQNLVNTVERGRDPQLKLHNGRTSIGLSEWGDVLFKQMQPVAQALDQANGNQHYSHAVYQEWQKLRDPEVTPSARMLRQMQTRDQDNFDFALALAEQYRQQLGHRPYHLTDEAEFVAQAKQSLQVQRAKELADNRSFDDFLADYFVYQDQGMGI